MARTQTAARKAPTSPASNNQGNRPQGVQPRKHRSRQHATRRANRSRLYPAVSSETPDPQVLQNSPAPLQSRGRKRKQPTEHALEPSPDPDPVAFWAKEGRWPEAQDWPEDMLRTDFAMDRLPLARKKSSSALSRKRSNSATSTTPSDQKPREDKSALYRDTRYPLLLQTKGSYMDISELGITDSSKQLLGDLISNDQPVPQGTLFDDDIFVDACRNLENKNEARIIQDISRLIVPSAESLALRNKSYKRLIESVNEGWNNSISLTGTRPQPDFSVGFRRDAFTEDQLAKLSPFIGDFVAGDQSFFMATYSMYFPFLTCEVKCGAAALDIADRQNAHSMTLAVRGIVELFRAVQREDTVDRKILAFSISHDHQLVRVYGHYPVISGKDTKYYRHPIRNFVFTELDGKEKWAAYRFTKNVYDMWMPAHFANICSAIDQLPPNLDFDDPPHSDDPMQSGACSASADEQGGGQSSIAAQQAVTPNTLLGGVAAKRRKGRTAR
ncbi:hypothetical protein BT67DRAFT_438617 [Trichocladium antarcticum]|uniref:DUF7924 domain-containing protein n=1 Tax=Trichocladium antarcticum TaxID=1450529 RepID=A0AAN6ZFL5_9PEZI|nr:hypothetical protein BT67DRAFT_438617 [Trichocladium antarcticum]